MKYDFPIPTRAEWQKIRDGAKVPKGAAKVSIGDAIEKAHKTFTPDSIFRQSQGHSKTRRRLGRIYNPDQSQISGL